MRLAIFWILCFSSRTGTRNFTANSLIATYTNSNKCLSTLAWRENKYTKNCFHHADYLSFLFIYNLYRNSSWINHHPSFHALPCPSSASISKSTRSWNCPHRPLRRRCSSPGREPEAGILPFMSCRRNWMGPEEPPLSQLRASPME